MDAQKSSILSLRARGHLACFTRPELKVERVSYPVMTPSAARGVLEAVLWKPAILWHIKSIHVLREIRFASFRRNEVNTKAVAPSAAVITNGGTTSHYFADEDRAQRNTVALRDVDYLIEAWFTMTDHAGPDDNVNKFTDMFKRRVSKGQYYHHPYLGCREFAADILTPDGAPPPIDDTRDLGIMLWDINFSDNGNTPQFFQAHLKNGVLQVPETPLTPMQQGGGS